MIVPNEAVLNAAKVAAEHAGHNGDMLGTITGILVMVGSLVSVVLFYLIRNRKLTIDYNSGLRSEFISEMHALRDEIKSLRGENEDLRGEVKVMRRENDLLREEVRQLHGTIDGLRRQSLQNTLSAQGDVLRTFPPNAIPQRTLEAMERMETNPTLEALVSELKRRDTGGEQ